MARIIRPSPVCPIHGKPSKRAKCRACNAAYMRDYLWRRRQQQPDRELWARAKKRAVDRGLPFNVTREEIIIPPACPALGIPLLIGNLRSANSPSLDRIEPALGYVSGNVRVISDRANRLKGDRNSDQLRECASRSIGPAKSEFELIAEYVEREALLREVRYKAKPGKQGHHEWRKIELFLDRVFSRGQLVDFIHSDTTENLSNFSVHRINDVNSNIGSPKMLLIDNIEHENVNLQ